MPIAIACPGCHRRLKVPEHLAGKRIRCPQCKEPVLVPLPEPPAVVEAPVEVEPLEDDTPPPRRRSTSKYKSHPSANNHLWVLAIGCSGLLLLVGGGLVGIILWARLKQPGHPELVTAVEPTVPKAPQTKTPPAPPPAEPKKPPIPAKANEGEQEPPPNPHTGKDRYYLRDVGFSIRQPTNPTDPPTTWQPVINNKKNPFLAFVGPKGGVKPLVRLDRPQLSIDRLDNLDGLPLDQFVAMDKAKIAQEMKDMQLLAESPLTIDDKPAYSLSFSGSLKSGAETVSTKWLRFYLAPDNQKRYILSFGALPGQFDQFRDMIEQCALSVHTD